MPSRRRTSPSASPSGAGSRASTCSAPSTSDDLAAEAANGLRHLDADRAAAEDEQAARDGLHAGHLAVASRRPRARAGPGSGGTNGSAPVARTTCSAVWRTPSTSTAPGPASRPRAAQQVDARARQPALLAGVGVVGDHEVAPARAPPRRRPPRSPPPRARRAPPRRGAAASSTGCTPSTSTRRRPARARRGRRAGRPRPARRRSARRASRRRATMTS